jgi:delta24(24(1))-sterol reductase
LGRKKELFDGMVETPARRNTRRKTQFTSTEDEAESTPPPEVMESKPLRRRTAPKFTEHLDELTPPETPVDSDSAETSPPKTNGKAANGTAVQAKAKVLDAEFSGEYEFGGPWFVSLMMVGFPILMWYMWIGATYYDGGFPVRAAGQSWGEFGNHLVNLVYTGAFPHTKAWMIYWIFFIVEGAFYCLMPGIWAYGKPLEHLGGKQLKYYCSAYTSWYATLTIVGGLHFSGVFPLYTIIDEFGPLLSVSILSGWIVAIVAYISALARGAQHRMSGNHVYDFFMGAELNPRMFGILDFKMFFEVRMPWYILFLLSCGAAARQWDRYGYVSGEVGFLMLAHFLYGNATAKGEELIVTTWDMYYEKWGFMLIFWNLSGVPLSYCHCTIYLANHAPETYRWNRWALAALYVSYVFVYWIWDSANSQKNRFRSMERGTLVKRNTFPQVPWQTLYNPKTIETGLGDKILADGWYGMARKVHYTCDVYFATTWALITGFNSPFPWFYPVFFVTMIAHRAWRDIARCREKYGAAWTEYEKQVPYLFIPVSFLSVRPLSEAWLLICCSTSSDFDALSKLLL